MLGGFNKMLGKLGLLDNEDAFRGVSLNARLDILKPKPKSLMDITLRIEKLSGKCILEKENDLVLRNLVRVLYHLLANYADAGSPSISVTDVGGGTYTGIIGTSTAYNYARSNVGFVNQGDVGVDSTGIVIGTGTTAPTRTDYAMQAKIPHGTGIGQIYYNRQSYELLSDYQFRFTREFTNAGSDLSVAEAGMIYTVQIYMVGGRNCLLLRDTFTPISVTAGNGIRVRYTFNF
jgi:hypothetical protein